MAKRLKAFAWVALPLLAVVVAALLWYPPLGGGQAAPESNRLVEYSADRVNINTATAAELSVLHGIGEVKAAAIVAWRETNGPFTSTEALLEVTGIGPATLAGILDNITVN